MKLEKQKTGFIFMLVLILFTVLFPRVEAYEEDSWIELKPMPTARVGLGVAVVDGKIYAIGGYNGSFLGTNEMYDPETNTWTTKSSMPTSRQSFGIAVYQNKIYCIGGWTDAHETGINEVYDPLTDTWATKKQLPTPRSGLDANVLDNKIFLIGGTKHVEVVIPFTSEYTYAHENQVYDPSTDEWSTKTPIPYGTFHYGSATVDNKIHFIGLTLHQIYDSETDTWTSGSLSPTEVFGAESGATTGKMAPKRLYLLAGMYYTSNVAVDLNQIYNPETDSWVSGAPMLTSRWSFGLAVVNDVIYTIGGKTGTDDSYSAANEVYVPVGYTMDFVPQYLNPLTITINSPTNTTYTSDSVFLNFTVNKDTKWMGYSLNGQTNVTLTSNTLNLTEFTNGSHSLTLYVKSPNSDAETSQTIYFTITRAVEPAPQTSEWLTIILVAVLILILVTVGLGLIIYFLKRK